MASSSKPTRFGLTLAVLDIKNSEFAELIGVNYRTAIRWSAQGCPKLVDQFLQALELLEQNGIEWKKSNWGRCQRKINKVKEELWKKNCS